MNARYLAQANLLLDLLPLVGQEKNIAVKGGTAINLFVRELPRLSVDIDLVYLPCDSRETALTEIDTILNRISDRIKRFKPNIKIGFKRGNDGKAVGLRVGSAGVVVKIEPNTVLRGCVYPAESRKLNPVAKKALGYEGFLSIPIASIPDLYGGKICAALDRQHPRDLFDIKVLFEHEGMTTKIRKAFVIYLASHDRPMHEVLSPRRLNVQEVFTNEFTGMTDVSVTYAELESVRERLISAVINDLTQSEKQFLISMKQGAPRWDLLGIPGIDNLPALQWKLMNIGKMDKTKHAKMLDKLKTTLKI